MNIEGGVLESVHALERDIAVVDSPQGGVGPRK
jgi:hypothetical protein